MPSADPPRTRRKPRTGATKSGSAPSAPPAARGGATLGRTLTFVSGNAGKVAELRALCAPLGIAVRQDARGYPEVQAATLAEVCQAGADHLLASGLRPPFVLEDSGLFVAALRGFPGVYSRHALDTIGCAGLLKLLVDVEAEVRTAAFQTHLLYVDAAGRRHGFDGACKGRIAERPAGTGGFGFDPVFVPAGPGLDGRTFAQMDLAAKNAVSHRGQAVRSFLGFLAKSPRGSPVKTAKR